jgi:predicted aconitase with swiveling domain
MTSPAGSEATLFVQHDTGGEVLTCREGLSFWGGVDPDTGVIIDTHHPDHGASLAGRIVLMPTSRGSCSGSGVLLQLSRNGKAPAALVFREAEDILTLGAIISARLFDRPVAVLRLPAETYEALSQAADAEIKGNMLRFADRHVELSRPQTGGLHLSQSDRARLAGSDGRRARLPWKSSASWPQPRARGT